jgi:archaellum component FlaC
MPRKLGKNQQGEKDKVPEFQRMYDKIDGVSEQISEVKEEVSEIRTQVKNLVGNGQPGRIDKIDNKIDEITQDVGALKSERDRAKGYFAGIAFVTVVFGWIGHILIDYVLPHMNLLTHK